VAISHKNLDGLLGLIVAGWLRQRGAFLLVLVGILVPLLIFVPCVGIPAVVAMLIGLLGEFKDWYYNRRLLCVDPKDQCVLGAIIHKPTASPDDGDRKMNLLLAPYTDAKGKSAGNLGPTYLPATQLADFVTGLPGAAAFGLRKRGARMPRAASNVAPGRVTGG
jgi:hypothetical protein